MRLDKGETLLSDAQLLARIGAWHLDVEAGALEIDEHMAGMLGLSALQLSWDQLLQVLHPDDLEGARAAYRHTLDTHEPFDGRLRVPHPDGSQLALRVRGVVASVAAGRVRGLRGFAQDITEQVAAEDALRESEELHRRIIETANDGIWMLDAEGQTSFVNRRMAEMLGYQPAEILGKTMFDFMDDEGFAASAQSFGGPELSSGQIEVRYRRKDGSPLWVLMSESELMDEQLNYAGGLAMVTDVTERKETELAAWRMAAVVEHAADAIVSTTIEDGSITSWNPAAQELLGYSAEEAVGRDLRELVLPPEVTEERIREANVRISAGESLKREESWLRHRDGHTVPVSVLLSPIRAANGKVLGISHFYRDLSNQIRAREENEQLKERLNQSQRLETVGQLAGGIAHDFNNLLAVILNCADFVEEDVPEDSPAHEDVLEIRRAAERAAALTRQLLVFSRRDVVQPAVLDVNGAVAEAEKLLRRTIGEHVALSTGLGEQIWPVMADQGQLEQVLVNLAVNARDAMPDGGRLIIETENVVLDQEAARTYSELEPGRYVQLSVTDTGTGMPPEVAARAFDPFFTTKPTGQGTGLGLATIYGIVKSAGGHVFLYSEQGHGTAVKIYLPAVEGEASTSVAGAAEPAPAGAGETILLVEDEQGVRESTKRILTRHGYNVVTATNGVEALAICDESVAIDLVLTDVVMPEMSGKQLALEIAERHKGTKVLYMSGYTDQQIAFSEAGSLIEKPFKSDALLRRIDKTLNDPALGVVAP
jgi:PAS domain S-box-containing protein